MEPVSQASDPAPAHQDSSTSKSGGYPAQVSIDYPAHQSRLLALFSIPFFLVRVLLIIPHIIVLYILQVAALLAVWINFWVVLFTGHSSKGLHDYASGTLRWSTRVNAYMFGLTDKYPPFRLKP